MKHIARITAVRPGTASTGLFVVMVSALDTMVTLLTRQRQSQWKTPFPQPIFFPPDEDDGGDGDGDGEA